MTRYNKKHEKKKQAPFKTHSRRTGKIILIALAVFGILGGSFFYIAWDEQQIANQMENDFRLLSCEQMKQELDIIVRDTGKIIKYYDWRVMAYNDKNC